MRAFPIALLTALGLIAQAGAAEFSSDYTDVNLDDCLVMSSDDFGSTWACPGYKGMPTYVAEGDLRFFVSYGFGADKERAAEQTPPPFNHLGSKIEWRLTDSSGGWRPFATIVRYFVSREDGEPEGQVLVVTQIEPGATCHIAYVDAIANADANALAQQAADRLAPGFDCRNEPEIVGKFEAW
jgi:hypothetical protein